jgi:hypothetical protein
MSDLLEEVGSKLTGSEIYVLMRSDGKFWRAANKGYCHKCRSKDPGDYRWCNDVSHASVYARLSTAKSRRTSVAKTSSYRSSHTTVATAKLEIYVVALAMTAVSVITPKQLTEEARQKQLAREEWKKANAK